MNIHTLPPAFAASQASFGIAFATQVERYYRGQEDIFTRDYDRWTSQFVVEPTLVDMPDWRLLLRQLKGASGLIYVHDVTNAIPAGGAKTGAALQASISSGAAFTWVNALGNAFAWENAQQQSFVWSDLPTAPSILEPRVAAFAPVGATEVRIEGLWPSNLGVIGAGDYIQIGHWLYLAENDANSDATGTAAVKITPPLWRSENPGATVKLECAATVMRLDQPSVDWSRAARERRTPLRLTFREVLPNEGVPL